MEAPNFIANGNISVSVFVKQDTSLDNGVIQASTNNAIIGVSQESSNYPPLPSVGTVYAAQAGQNVKVYGHEQQCLLLIGSGGCTAGDRLKSDSSGAGVTIASSGPTAQNVGAIALSTANAGEYARVLVFKQDNYYPALS